MEAAKKKLGNIQELLTTTLTKLAERQHLSLPSMVFLGDAFESIGMRDAASQVYKNILEKAKSDETFAKSASKATARVRTQLIGVLRQSGQFEQALQQANQLIAENPRALEPRMEKGRILEAWAEKEPSRYTEAISHWSNLRNQLQQIRGKKPPEYYDVVYRVADDLIRDAQTFTDKKAISERAKQAEQVLKSALTLSPTLDGPDTVARYKVLLKKAIVMQGRQPNPE
jgi:tetratricopeptide (TPR) repeat protein